MPLSGVRVWLDEFARIKKGLLDSRMLKQPLFLVVEIGGCSMLE